MFNNRMLAVAAVLVMAVPALGAATPIVVPPVPEQLVEGHTVFTVIEIVAATQTNETRFAAAVAVLVREYQAENNAQRFPGVLWFNDQYLVNPYQNANENAAFRYPCGGAVMAVNQGDPDPRMVIARINTPLGGAVVGPDSYMYEYEDGWVKPYPSYDGDPDGDTTGDSDSSASGSDLYYYGQDGDTSNDVDTDGDGDIDSDPRTDYAWLGVDATGASPVVYSDSVLGVLTDRQNAADEYEYEESYLITDPNDHSWIIDKYNFISRDGDILGGGTTSIIYDFPVWVVNMLGSPVFVPDNGIAINFGEFVGENCVPFKDTLDAVLEPLKGSTCGLAAPNFLGTGNDDEITLSHGDDGVPAWTDDPCMSYSEPSDNGYCYGGQAYAPDNTCPHGPPGNCAKNVDCDGNVNKPLRQYNALLYFKLEDLTIRGLDRDHCGFDPTLNGGAGGCNPALVMDTNGCSEEQYWWGPNPPQAANDWPCPDPDGAGGCTNTNTQGVVGDDDCEGNSHPFHPDLPVHEEAEDCLPPFAGPNPTNHGGSTYADVGQGTVGGWYQEAMPCDYLHATRNIDIYFSPGGRPFPPVLRIWDVIDLEGSSAPFQDYHTAYPGAP